MSRPSFHQQVKKQKERARKARAEEKQQRRSARGSAEETSGEGAPTEAGAASEPPSQGPSG
jgi:hypothetical protein